MEETIDLRRLRSFDEIILAMKESVGKTFKLAFQASIPVMAGYVVMGIGFGVLLASHGYGPLWALAMSLLMESGSMQFVGIDLLAGGASVISTAIMTVMVQIRHIFYSVSMVGTYRNFGKKKWYLAGTLTDETYALLCNLDLPEDVDKERYCLLVSALDHFYWIIGGLIGNIIGISVDFDFTGIDFAMTAIFITIATDQWMKNKDHRPAIIGFVASLGCLIAIGPDNFLIPTMILITLALLVMRKIGGGEHD